jgi:hypothetical protein
MRALPSRAPRHYIFSLSHAVFSQLSFPQGCFREHDITGWLNATARDAPDIMQVTLISLPVASLVASLISLSSYSKLAIMLGQHGSPLSCCPCCPMSQLQPSFKADTSISWSRLFLVLARMFALNHIQYV